MVNDRVQNLAETLKKSGLAASATEAMRMAQSISGTESKVAKDFDNKNEKIDKSLEKKSYQEEIAELIQKTSPEHKDYHIPVRGYSREVMQNQPARVSVESAAAPSRPPQTSMAQEQTRPVPEQIPQPPSTPAERPVPKQLPRQESHNAPAQQEEAKAAPPGAIHPTPPSQIKPVFTDVLDDERSLMEIMNEDAQNIYDKEQTVEQDNHAEQADTRVDETPEYTVYNVPPAQTQHVAAPSQTQHQEPAERRVEQEPTPAQPNQNQHQPVQAEPKQAPAEEKKEFKNPIDKVDLSDYFSFG